MHRGIITTIVTSKRELQHHHHTTRVSTEKERKEWERIKATKTEKKQGIRKKKTESVEWQACTK